MSVQDQRFGRFFFNDSLIEQIGQNRFVFKELLMDILDNLILHHPVVPLLEMTPLRDVHLVVLDVDCLMEDKQVSDCHISSTEVVTSL